MSDETEEASRPPPRLIGPVWVGAAYVFGRRLPWTGVLVHAESELSTTGTSRSGAGPDGDGAQKGHKTLKTPVIRGDTS